MTSTERQAVRRARALLVAGDARAALELLRALEAARPHRAGEDVPQLTLELPERIDPGALVEDCPARCRGLTARQCVARQMLSDLELARRRRKDRSAELKRHDAKRGTATTLPTCRTELCRVGARVRAALGEDPEAMAMARRAPRASDTPA